MNQTPDNFWAIVGVLVAVTIGVISIVLQIKSRERRELAYCRLTALPLFMFAPSEGFKEKLEVLYEGVSIKNAYLVRIELMNRGTTSIKLPATVTEYEYPVSIEFTEGGHILYADITAREPQSLRVTASIQDNKIVISPCLLERNEKFIITTIIGDITGSNMVVDGRIAGVSIYKFDDKNTRISTRSRRALWGVFILIAYFMATAFTMTVILMVNEYRWLVILGLLIPLFSGIAVCGSALFVNSYRLLEEYRELYDFEIENSTG